MESSDQLLPAPLRSSPRTLRRRISSQAHSTPASKSQRTKSQTPIANDRVRRPLQLEEAGVMAGRDESIHNKSPTVAMTAATSSHAPAQASSSASTASVSAVLPSRSAHRSLSLSDVAQRAPALPVVDRFSPRRPDRPKPQLASNGEEAPAAHRRLETTPDTVEPQNATPATNRPRRLGLRCNLTSLFDAAASTEDSCELSTRDADRRPVPVHVSHRNQSQHQPTQAPAASPVRQATAVPPALLQRLGSMAHLGYDAQLQSPVIIRNYATTHQGVDPRFLHEVQMLREVKHPNLLTGLQIYTQADAAYISLPIVDYDLSEAISLIHHPGREWCQQSHVLADHYLHQILAGLAHLHERLIVHSDLRPETIRVSCTHHVRIGGLAAAQRLPTAQSWPLGLNKHTLFPLDSQIAQLFAIFRCLGTPTSEGLLRLDPAQRASARELLRSLSDVVPEELQVANFAEHMRFRAARAAGPMLSAH
ncbi:uncharacterized protein MONBRDRAFT_28714 [Monosiga brevicollis MX1]|uniref:Protein kinase domain-containing protein n=1 Tax=Monosiga brevicollis TaxID=81824 RepID=A9V8Z3_MONBE|nr:uncharacterized protein MONBRDRAFT_28714 [Monosiga brevicollis MX1]EDQ85962.1 predicted protein [Monosiga brevicollis MX1]|eukprot:XP_001749156.1 hypothetical protein [Monosiga brevicollis MX1]